MGQFADTLHNTTTRVTHLTSNSYSPNPGHFYRNKHARHITNVCRKMFTWASDFRINKLAPNIASFFTKRQLATKKFILNQKLYFCRLQFHLYNSARYETLLLKAHMLIYVALVQYTELMSNLFPFIFKHYGINKVVTREKTLQNY